MKVNMLKGLRKQAFFVVFLLLFWYLSHIILIS